MAGKGEYSIVADNDPKKLKTQVVSSLKKASEPSLQGCTFQFGTELNDLGNLWRNELVRQYRIMTEKEF